MRRYQISLAGKVFEVEIVSVRGEMARVLVNGRPYEVQFTAAAAPAQAAPTAPVRVPAPPPPPSTPEAAPAPPPAATEFGPEWGAVLAPMPGSVLEVLVQPGDRVHAGETVVKIEAMKMENEVKAAGSGVVADVRVSKGVNIAKGDVLLVIAPH